MGRDRGGCLGILRIGSAMLGVEVDMVRCQ